MNHQEEIDNIITEINISIEKLQFLSYGLYSYRNNNKCLAYAMTVLSHADSINKNSIILNHHLMKKYASDQRMISEIHLVPNQI